MGLYNRWNLKNHEKGTSCMCKQRTWHLSLYNYDLISPYERAAIILAICIVIMYDDVLTLPLTESKVFPFH
jgi:hypothetical protein